MMSSYFLRDYVSIHALTRSATQISVYYEKEYQFQSTHSRGVRQGRLPACYPRFQFQSTHSRGVRPNKGTKRIGVIAFQSTHSRGVRLSSPYPCKSPVWFQSTHSRGVRPSNSDTIYLLNNVSIHALTRSATQSGQFHAHNLFGFNPRTHEECDISVGNVGRRSKCFNPRTHEECDRNCNMYCRVRYSFNPRTHEECDRF